MGLIPSEGRRSPPPDPRLPWSPLQARLSRIAALSEHPTLPKPHGKTHLCLHVILSPSHYEDCIAGPTSPTTLPMISHFSTFSTKSSFLHSTHVAQCHNTYIYPKLFPQVDNPAPTGDGLRDDQNGKNTKPKPTKGTGTVLRRTSGFPDVHDPSAQLLDAIMTGADYAMI